MVLRRTNICSRQCSHLRTYVRIEKTALGSFLHYIRKKQCVINLVLTTYQQSGYNSSRAEARIIYTVEKQGGKNGNEKHEQSMRTLRRNYRER